ncbi:MAG TPA: ABC transporter permease [Candidatus Limnocylindrales bacterium]|nr:ABC transporter permease [Candidatus Limnocylindrales bacterium]
MRNLLPNAWHVARREYTQRVRSRTFAITTAILAVVGLGLGLLPVGIRLIAGDEAARVGLVAPADTVQAAQLQAILTANAGGQSNGYQVVPVSDEATGRADVRSGDLDGLLTVSRTPDADLAFNFYSDAGATSQTLQAVRSATTQLTIADRLQRAGVDPGEAGQIFAATAFQLEPTDPNASRGAFDGPQGLVAYVLVILTFMAVVTYGSWVAASVAEEKSSRVMELLITAATPRQLLAGKVMGTGGAGLTQYLVILVAALIGLLLQGTLAARLFGDANANLLEGVDMTVLFPFTLFFVPGFLLYCVLYAGFGSVASRQEDVTQVTGPMLFIGMGGYFASFVAMATPDVAWVKLLSLIPFFSPYLLSARFILAGNVAAWEWAVAAVLMVLFLAGALWLAARIYSAGVLMYGQRSNLRSAWRAVRVNR